MEREVPSHSSLGYHSKECGDQCDLTSHIAFRYALHLYLDKVIDRRRLLRNLGSLDHV